jgi:hypothetical protein
MEVAAFMGLASLGMYLTSGKKDAKKTDAFAADAAGKRAKYAEKHSAKQEKDYLAYMRPSEAPSPVDYYDSRHAEEVAALDFGRGYASYNNEFNGVKGGRRDTSAYSELAGAPIEAFTHNNMQPFYSGAPKQAAPGSRALVDAFYGGSDLADPKRETEAFFQPERDMGFVNGAPAASEDARSRYEAPRSRNHEFPIAPQLVGPGMASGYVAEPEDVYVKQREYAMPRSVDELRTADRPRVSHEGRVVDGMKGLGERGLFQGFEKRTADTFKVTTEADLLPTAGAFRREAGRPALQDRPTQRQDTSRELAGGPYIPGVGRAQAAQPSGAPFRASLPAFGLGQASLSGRGKGAAFDHGRTGIQVYTTGRETMEVSTSAGSLTTAVKALVAPWQDKPRATKADMLAEAPRDFGNAKTAVPKLTIYDPEDVARTTMRQTLDEGQGWGNVSSAVRRGTSRDPSDHVRTTTRETLDEGQSWGNVASAERRGTSRDPDDRARTTTRETVSPTEHERNVNPRAKRQVATMNPGEIARRTGRETLEEPTRGDGLPDALEGRRAGAYANTEVSLAPTMREIGLGDHYGGPTGRAGGGYEVFPQDGPRDTLRQGTSQEYYGGAGTTAAKSPMDHTATDNARVCADKESVLGGRDPGPQGPKVASGADAVSPDVYRQALDEPQAALARAHANALLEIARDAGHEVGLGTRVKLDAREAERIDDVLVAQRQQNEFATSIV